MPTSELEVGPVAIENLNKSARRDGFKRYHDQAKAQLIAQVREARYSIAALARVNGLNANLLHKSVLADEGVRPRSKLLTKPKARSVLLPVKITTLTPLPDKSMIDRYIEVQCKRGTLRLPMEPWIVRAVIDALSI